MLRKVITILLVSLIVSVVTYKLPFYIGNEINISKQKPNIEEMPLEIKELYEKKYLTEEDLKEFEKWAGNKSIENGINSYENISKDEIHRLLRLNNIWYFALVWFIAVLLLDIPREVFFLVILFPAIFFLANLFIDIELFIIGGILVGKFILVWTQRKIK